MRRGNWAMERLAQDAVLGFFHSAIDPPHRTAFATKWNFENNVCNNLRYMSIDHIFSAN